MNRLGLRGPEIEKKLPGGTRILALGDSFTFGVGAQDEETFPARLEEVLRASGIPAQVLNAGAPGFGVPDAVAWYERYGIGLDPDAIVLAIFLANDLQDASPDQPKVAVVDGALVVPGETAGPRRWLYYHSHLFRLLKSSVLEGRVRSLFGLKEPWAVRELRSEFSLYEPTLRAELKGGAEVTERSVAKLANLARSRSTRVLAVLIPSLPQVDAKRWEAVLGQLGLDPAGHDRRRPNRLFREILERHQVPVLDLTDEFEKALGHGNEIFYPIDQHLTPEGYALMARVVSRAWSTASPRKGARTFRVPPPEIRPDSNQIP